MCGQYIPLCSGPCTEVVYCLLSRKNRLQNPAGACDGIRDSEMKTQSHRNGYRMGKDKALLIRNTIKACKICNEMVIISDIFVQMMFTML